MHDLAISAANLINDLLEVISVIVLHVTCKNIFVWHGRGRQPLLNHCIKFTVERQVFNDIVSFQPLCINLFLFGNENWNIETNIVLFRSVCGYIHVTKRLNNILTPCLKLILNTSLYIKTQLDDQIFTFYFQTQWVSIFYSLHYFLFSIYILTYLLT